MTLYVSNFNVRYTTLVSITCDLGAMARLFTTYQLPSYYFFVFNFIIFICSFYCVHNFNAHIKHSAQQQGHYSLSVAYTVASYYTKSLIITYYIQK